MIWGEKKTNNVAIIATHYFTKEKHKRSCQGSTESKLFSQVTDKEKEKKTKKNCHVLDRE